MPKPAQDSYTDLYGPAYYYYDGSLTITIWQIWKSGRTAYPASVNNPLVLGYRSPSNRYRVNNRWECSEGRIRIQHSDGTIVSGQGYISGWGNGEANSLCQLDPALADDVLRKCLSQMLEDDVAFNAFMLQGKQALRMVTNLATGIAHGTDSLMTADFGSPKKFKRFLAGAADSAIRNFSGKYLEFLYGWKPLADDVENAFSAMIDGYTGPEAKTFRMSVRKSRRLKQDLTVNVQSSAYWTSNWWWEQTLTRTNRAKVVLHYQFPNQVGEMLPTMTPFGTLWELTPWSFVVDWFVPIGDWVGAMEATQYAIYMTDAVLTQSVEVASGRGATSSWTTKVIPYPWKDLGSRPPRLSGKSFYMTREVLSPVAVLDRIRFPSFSSKFGLPQATQALALLQQVLNKWF